MKTLRLVRDVPGPTEQTRETGGVAEAVVFSDGRAVLHWLTDPRGTEFYESEADMREVREASGRSRFTETGKLMLPQAGTGNLRDRLQGLREVQAGWAFGVPEDGREQWLDAVAGSGDAASSRLRLRRCFWAGCRKLPRRWPSGPVPGHRERTDG